MLVAVIAGTGAQAEPTPGAATAATAQAAPDQASATDAELVRDRFSPPAARAEAARRLTSAADPNARAALVAMVSEEPPSVQSRPQAAPEPGPDAQTLILDELVASVNAPPWLVTPLSQRARNGSAPGRVRAALALSSVRTRESVRALLSLAGSPDTSAEVRDTAFRSLSRLSGQPFPPDLKAWSLWFTQVEWLPEAEWRRILAEGLAGRADAAARERDLAMGRLGEDLRKTFAGAVTPEERSTLLDAFIRDDLLPVRRLGFALALQELANARALDQRVATAAAGAIRDPNVEVRRSASGLLNVLAGPALAPSIRESLATETDPEVASVLLRLGARWPAENVRPVALRWLESDGPARIGAMDALGALLGAGMLEAAADRARVLTIVRAAPVETLPPSGLRLLFALGSDDDRARVFGLLTTGEADRRRDVGDTLAADKRALEPILKAAASDLALYAVAGSALAMHRPTADGYAALAALPAASSEARRRALLAFAAGLGTGELLAVARELNDPSLAEAMLARLTTEPLQRRFSGGGPVGRSRFTQNPSVVAGLLLLCRQRLDLGQPAAALTALDALTPVRDGMDEDQRDSMRTVALLCLNRVDDALVVRGPVEAWIDGLERSIDQAHGQAILRAIDSRFGAEVSPDVAERLRPLRARLRLAIGPEAPEVVKAPEP